MRYPSGKSSGFGILLWGVILILIISTIIVPEQYRWMVLLGTILCSLLLLWIWFGTFYKFKDKYLLIRMGPFFERIPCDKITSARKFRSMASSMALSSQMIELRHGKNYITGTTYISPQDRDRFLTELSLHCPGLKTTD